MQDQDRKIEEVKFSKHPSCTTLSIKLEKGTMLTVTSTGSSTVALFDLIARDYHTIAEACKEALKVLEL